MAEAKLSWMRNCCDVDVVNGKYDYEHVNREFETDFYHDVYYSYIASNTYYVDDLKAMKRFEALNPTLYSGLFDDVTTKVLRCATEHCNYATVSRLVVEL